MRIFETDWSVKKNYVTILRSNASPSLNVLNINKLEYYSKRHCIITGR